MIAKFGMSKMAFLLFLGVILVVASLSLSFAQVFLSPDIPVTIGSATFQERDIICYEASSFSLHLSGSDLGIPDGVNIDAFGFSGSNIFFSVDILTTLDGVVYTERDLILYDGDNFSKLLDGPGIGIPDGACIGAATAFSDGSIIFSLDIPVSLGGIPFKANDLIKYDGSSFDPYFSGSDNGIPENANIDGVWVSLEGDILFSLDIPCSLNGLDVKDKDIIKWSEGSFSLYFDGIPAGLPSGADVNACAYADICECDLNHDGRCDMEDWLLFGDDWGRTDCHEPGVECECDLNDDGRCDMEDWLMFGEDWGRTDCL